MIRSYYYNPLGNDGIKNPSGVIRTYTLFCDRFPVCGNKINVSSKNKVVMTVKDINFPDNWIVYHPDTLIERHICPDCNKGGYK